MSDTDPDIQPAIILSVAPSQEPIVPHDVVPADNPYWASIAQYRANARTTEDQTKAEEAAAAKAVKAIQAALASAIEKMKALGFTDDECDVIFGHYAIAGGSIKE